MLNNPQYQDDQLLLQQQQQQQQQEGLYMLLKVPQYVHELFQPAFQNGPTDWHTLGAVEIHTLPNGTQEHYLVVPVQPGTPGLDPNATELRLPLTTVKPPSSTTLALFQPQHNEHLLRYEHSAFVGVIKEAKLPMAIHQNLIKHQKIINEAKHQAKQLQVGDFKPTEGSDLQAEFFLEAAQQHQHQVENRKENRVKRSEEEILQMLYTVYESVEFCSKQDLMTWTNQPKAPIDDVVAKYCIQLTEGPGRGKYTLKSLYNKKRSMQQQ